MAANVLRVSSRELAERLGCDYLMANTLIRLFEQKGLARHVETRKPEGKRGRGTKVYEVPKEVNLQLNKRRQTGQLTEALAEAA